MRLKPGSCFEMNRNIPGLSAYPNYNAINGSRLVERSKSRFYEAIYSLERNDFSACIFY